MIYFVWELLASVLLYFKINRKQGLLLLSIVLWVLMAFRPLELGLYDTEGIFLRGFNRFKGLNLDAALDSNEFAYEPLMTIYTWVCSNLFKDYRFFVALSSLFPIYSVYKLLEKETKQPIFGLIVYFSLFYFYNSYMIKQMIALAFVILSITYIKEDNFLKFVVCIGAAGLFHKSAWIFGIAYFACKNIKFNRSFFILIAIGLLIGLFGSNYILRLLYMIPGFNFENYIAAGIYSTGNGFNFSTYLYIIIIALCFSQRVKNKNNKIYNAGLILAFLGCILNSWSSIIVEFYRVSIYFNIFLVILVPSAIETINPKYRKIIVAFVLLFFFAYAFRTAYNTNCLHYII